MSIQDYIDRVLDKIDVEDIGELINHSGPYGIAEYIRIAMESTLAEIEYEKENIMSQDDCFKMGLLINRVAVLVSDVDLKIIRDSLKEMEDIVMKYVESSDEVYKKNGHASLQ